MEIILFEQAAENNNCLTEWLRFINNALQKYSCINKACTKNHQIIINLVYSTISIQSNNIHKSLSAN